MVDTVLPRPVRSALAALAAAIVAIALVPVPSAAAQPAAHADPPLAYRACPKTTAESSCVTRTAVNVD